MIVERKKLIYIISLIDFSYGMEWVAEHLDREKYDIELIFLNKDLPQIYNRLKSKNFKVSFIKYRGKRDIFKAIIRLFIIFRNKRPHIIHAHLFDASFAAMIAARMAGVKKRIYTRHHADAQHIDHPHAVKYDKLINYLSTGIIAVSQGVKNVLVKMEKTDEKKIFVIHHGFDFNLAQIKEEELLLIRRKYNLEGCYPVIGVISRFFPRKGVQYIIPAFNKLLADYPKAKLVLANASGVIKNEIMELLETLPDKNYVTIEHEKLIYSLINCFDIFVHVPVDPEYEAFGQIYVEAMSCKVPVVCTLSGIAGSYIVNRKNALVVPYRNSDKIYESILELLHDKGLKEAIVERAYNDVTTQFQISKMIKELEQVYG